VSGKNIISLSGIEHFTALESLNCSNNELTSLDLSNNTALTTLYCSDNELTSLDLSNNITLTMLYCSNNKLTLLDVSGCSALKYICANDNCLIGEDKIIGLDKSKLRSLIFNPQNIEIPAAGEK
jgi:Leucine-rich repeat (LRR) protein